MTTSTRSLAANPQSLRILVVEFLPSGGMFQFGFQFANSLASVGHRVDLMTGPRPELMPEQSGLHVIDSLPTWHPNADATGGGLKRKIRRVWRALLLAEAWRQVLVHTRRTRPDVVQFGELRYALDTVGFLALARFGHQHIIADVAHNPVPYDVHSKKGRVEKSGPISRGLLTRAYNAADLIFVLAKKPRDELIANFPSVQRVAICGHGDYSGILDAAEPGAPSKSGQTILFFGAWTKYKNIPLLLDAFALARKTVPNARLTLAGPPMPDIEIDNISRQANEIGNVDLRPGYVPLEEVPSLFGSHRALIFTYDTVNVSGSVHMAFTFGRPVIATDVGAMSDVVEHGVTGMLTRPNLTDIATALIEVLTNDTQADQMGVNAWERSRDSSSWSTTAHQATEAYIDALDITQEPSQ